MSDAETIIQDLKLKPHPEGGHFAECLRTQDISIIYYLLKQNEKSHWHRLEKNETLHFYKGSPLIIYSSKISGATLTSPGCATQVPSWPFCTSLNLSSLFFIYKRLLNFSKEKLIKTQSKQNTFF